VSAEEDLARLERQVLGVARVSRFLVAVDELRRMLATEDPRLRARVLALVAPTIGRDLAAAVGAAFDIGIRDAVGILDEGEPKGVRRTPPPSLVTAARAAQSTLIEQVAAARKLARAGADPATFLSPVIAAGNAVKRDVTTLVNAAGNAGSTAVADAAGVPTVWVAETNACVTCLGYSGEIARPGKNFPAGRTYGKTSTVSAPIAHPPAHPNCRCTVEPLRSPEYAVALRREADRSVLRGFSLESESMGVRIDAARRLVENGVDAPKSVIAYARRSIRAGEFATRGRP